MDFERAGVTSGLAAVQRVTLRRIGADDRPGPALYTKTDLLMTTTSDEGATLPAGAPTQEQWAGARRSTVAFRDEHRQRAIAEIEQAYVALRRAEPALDPWSKDAAESAHSQPPSGETPPAHSAWPLIGGIWVATIVVVGAALAAMVYLLS
jgi:hypothetical protein